MAKQPKITAFFNSPKTVQPPPPPPATKLDGDGVEICIDEEIETARDLKTLSGPKVDEAPMIFIEDEEEDDSDDEVQKPRTKKVPNPFDESPNSKQQLKPAQQQQIKQKLTQRRSRTPKQRKSAPPRVEDGIIGMKVRSPTNGPS